MVDIDATLYKSDFPDALRAIVGTRHEPSFCNGLNKYLPNYYRYGAFNHLLQRSIASGQRCDVLFILHNKMHNTQVQLLQLAPGDCCLPHITSDIAAASLLLQGSVEMVEATIGEIRPAHVTLTHIGKRSLAEKGQLFHTAQHQKNLHFFYATEPALLLQVHIRRTAGTVATPQAAYADLAALSREDGMLIAPLIDKKMAQSKYNRDNRDNYLIPFTS